MENRRKYTTPRGVNGKDRRRKQHESRAVRNRRLRKKRLLRKRFFLLLALVVCLCVGFRLQHKYMSVWMVSRMAVVSVPEWIDVQYIPEGNPSRSEERLEAVRDIVVHYVGNPGTTAQANHDYYCHEDSVVCSHFVVGLEGEIILCLPLNERSAASNHRNKDTISIEVCHPDDTGKFSDATYDSLVRLVAWLTDICHLDTEHVIRHYDVTGKECPRYYVRNEDAWIQFKEDVDRTIR